MPSRGQCLIQCTSGFAHAMEQIHEPLASVKISNQEEHTIPSGVNAFNCLGGGLANLHIRCYFGDSVVSA